MALNDATFNFLANLKAAFSALVHGKRATMRGELARGPMRAVETLETLVSCMEIARRVPLQNGQLQGAARETGSTTGSAEGSAAGSAARRGSAPESTGGSIGGGTAARSTTVRIVGSVGGGAVVTVVGTAPTLCKSPIFCECATCNDQTGVSAVAAVAVFSAAVTGNRGASAAASTAGSAAERAAESAAEWARELESYEAGDRSTHQAHDRGFDMNEALRDGERMTVEESEAVGQAAGRGAVACAFTSSSDGAAPAMIAAPVTIAAGTATTDADVAPAAPAAPDAPDAPVAPATTAAPTTITEPTPAEPVLDSNSVENMAPGRATVGRATKRKGAGAAKTGKTGNSGKARKKGRKKGSAGKVGETAKAGSSRGAGKAVNKRGKTGGSNSDSSKRQKSNTGVVAAARKTVSTCTRSSARRK